ncbi:hypothetical protein [Halomonas citrativorans]|uniref:Uncharacterized protein n=1 Tax=Halomonas citrativorans TaxID=2742612 RepID=A0ABR9FFC7_9GAMM|nr:hypothetical protein [Halomonas citrativorans]MBE0405009.1 hypothetical protein [Halomonas citrativorans]
MAQTDNIQAFDELTGSILARLYSAFPVPITLKAGDFVDNPLVYSEHVQCDVASEEARFFTATAKWLQMAGYIYLKEIDRGNLYVTNCVLTAKSLELLKVKPANLSNEASLGDQLTAAAKQGSNDAVRKAITEVLSHGARFMLQTIN